MFIILWKELFLDEKPSLIFFKYNEKKYMVIESADEKSIYIERRALLNEIYAIETYK